MRYCIYILFCLCLFLSYAGNAQDIENFKDEKWATVHGAIGATASIYAMDGAPARRVPFSWLISGQMSVSIKGLELPFSFQFSEQDRSFRQPFNQFGVSPSYKWVRLHLGWRSMSMSHYTLDGYTFLGAGVELNPGKLRFAAMYGRLLKAVQEDTSKQVYNSLSQYPYAAYNRMGYAVKLGVGSEKNFIDFIYFKGKDDTNSVHRNPQIQQIQPGENVTIGIKNRLTFFSKLFFDVDAGISVYTRDVRADTVALNTGFEDVTKKMIVPLLSTNLYYAGDASLQYREKQFGIALKYALVAPDYKSMGIYYIQTDFERITLSPFYNNKKSTVQVNGSIGFEKDDLLRKKLAQTQRLINSLSINLNPKPAYGLSLQYSNFGITQQPGLKSLNDTVLLNQVSQSIIASPRYTLQKDNAIHTFSYMFADQTLNDKNKFQSQQFNMASVNNTLSYVVFITKLNSSFDVSGFYSNTTISAGTSIGKGASAGISTSFLKNKITSSLNSTYSRNEFNGASDGFTLQFHSGNQWNVTKHHLFKLDITLTDNQSKTQLVSKSFDEWLCTAMYNYRF